jgi:hypothetical protein
MKQLWLVPLTAAVIAGCSNGAKNQAVTPAAPVPAAAPPAAQAAAAPPTYTSLYVYVSDAILRDVSGATVQLVDDDQVSRSAVTDTKGVVRISGRFGGSVVAHVNRAGFDDLATTAVVHPASYIGPGVGVIDLELEAPDPVQLMSGKYSVTFSTDGSCTNVPADLQTRTYAASVIPSSAIWAPRNYLVNFDPPLKYFGFGLGVSGHDVGVTIDGPTLVDPIGLEIEGGGSGTQPTSRPSAVSIPFYFILTYGGQECRGKNGSLTLAPR